MSKPTQEIIEEVFEKFDEKFDSAMKGCGVGYGKSQIWAHSFLSSTLTKIIEEREKELIEKIEKLIQEERFSGAPYALNKIITLITNKE